MNEVESSRNSLDSAKKSRLVKPRIFNATIKYYTVNMTIAPSSTISNSHSHRSQNRKAIPRGPTNLPDGPYRRRGSFLAIYYQLLTTLQSRGPSAHSSSAQRRLEHTQRFVDENLPSSLRFQPRRHGLNRSPQVSSCIQYARSCLVDLLLLLHRT